MNAAESEYQTAAVPRHCLDLLLLTTQIIFCFSYPAQLIPAYYSTLSIQIEYHTRLTSNYLPPSINIKALSARTRAVVDIDRGTAQETAPASISQRACLALLNPPDLHHCLRRIRHSPVSSTRASGSPSPLSPPHQHSVLSGTRLSHNCVGPAFAPLVSHTPVPFEPIIEPAARLIPRVVHLFNHRSLAKPREGRATPVSDI